MAFAIISCTASKQTTSTGERQLSQQLVTSVLWYQQSAEMVASYLQAYEYGKLVLAAKIDTIASERPLAVVLDIDETVLDNSPYEVKQIKKGQVYQFATWKAWTDQARAKALPGALDFINFAKSKGVEVFYISNRRENELNATIQNLQNLGFPNADAKHVYLRSATSDKTARRDLVAESFNIILFVGDNLTDYSEIYANRGENLGKEAIMKNKADLLYNFIMLPNPMYGEWESAIYDNDNSISAEEKLKKRLEVLED
ncbi:5'-nucleotidase, lipoprotein e(P4) family [Fulvivirga imtechensis AK7]|uniref:5'-nucleotidase, lipoprotein e(P4) family n=2 Tax=Fulvivirga TaxID=396811 RepID=L8JZM5_9BACT|nr:5'-nucleotidase, lipoprotein e(P4) family [Fulvivirga imtechensis AK7]